jgi:hypothetical protein
MIPVFMIFDFFPAKTGRPGYTGIRRQWQDNKGHAHITQFLQPFYQKGQQWQKSISGKNVQ